MTSTSLPQPALPQSPVTVNPWESLAAEARVEREKKAEETWGATMRAAIETDPGVAAEADKLARRIGQPLLAASQDMNFLRGVALMNRMREDRIQSTNPVLYKSLQGLEFARKAWNDYESLGMFERWGQAFTRGELTSQRGRAAAVGDVVGQQAAEARLARTAPTVGLMGNAMEIVGQWASSLPAAMEGAVKGAALGAGAAALATAVLPPAEAITVPAGTVLGFKAGFLSALAVDQGKIMAGNAYVDMVQAGYDPERALWASRALGIANMALEMGGAGLATSGVRTAIRDRLFKSAVNEIRSDATTSALRGFAKEYLVKNIGGETGTEVWEEINTIIAEELAARGGEQDMNPEGVAMRLWEVASKTMQGMAVLGVPSGIGGAARAKMAQEAAKLDQQELQRAQKILEPSELVKNDPEAASQYVGEVLNQREVHVDAQAMREALAKLDADMTASGQLRKSALDQLEAIVPGITEQLETAAERGGDVSLPMADYLTRMQVEMPELVAALQENWRMDPESVEVEQVDAKTQEGAEKLAAQADTGTDAEAKFREELRTVEKSAAEQMLAVGGERVGSQGARDSARLYASVVSIVARSENLSPEEASKKYGPAFIAEETAGRGLFDRDRMAIVFGPTSGPETAAHELVHWATDVVERLDAAGSTYGKQQMDVLLQRWNLTREQWAAMDLAARRPYLEDIAYNAEESFATGEAPSEELRGVFQRMKALIVGLYRNVRSFLVQGYRDETGQELPAMTPELRGYLDRLFASEEAIEIEKATRNGAAALLGEQVSGIAGIDPADVAEIRQRAEEADAEAKERLTSEVLRGSRYYQAAKRNAEADAKRKLREAEEAVRAEVEKAVSDSPVYRVLAFIRTGKVQDANGKETTAKLDTDEVRRLLGDDADKLPGGLTKKRGLSPDLVAQAHGFQGGPVEMLRAILAAPPMQEAIDQRVRERVEAEEPLADPKEFKRAVEDALHGKAATRLTSTILRAFLKGVKATTAGLEQEARLAARITLERTPVGRINVRQFAAAERRTLQKRDRALKAGKFDEVIEAQRQLLLQQYLTMEAIKVEREIERGVKTAGDRFGKSNEAILKERRNLDTVQAGRVIMGRFGLLPQSMAEAALASMKQMQQVDPDGYGSLMADVAKEVVDSRPWREVPLDRFRVLAATLDGMWTKSKRSEQFRIAGKMRDRAEVLAEMEDGIVQVAGAGTRAGLTMGKAAQELSAMTVESVMANMTRMEAWAIAMDGGKKGGPFHRYVYQPLADAATAASLELEERMAWVTETLGKFDDLSATVDLSQFSGGHPLASIKTRAELIGAILHMGTESGYRAFILGNKWGEQVGGDLVTQWDKALQHAADMGWLTEQDFKLVQSVWDYIGSEMKLRMFAATHENWGYRPVEVQARPVQTPFGQLPGGYYPAKVDKARSTIADDKKLDAIKQGKADFQAANINVPRGQTITRQENAVQPRLLDLNVLGQHLAEAINIIHIQPAIADVARMFSGRNNTMLATLAQVAPYAKQNIVIPALERMSRDSIMAPTNELIRWAATFLRKSASMAFLGFNPKNAALQFTGLASAAAEVGFTNIVSHFMDVMRGNGEVEASIEAKSDAMRVRWSNAMQLMASDLEQMVSPSKLKKAQDVAQRAAFFLQRWAQRKVDAATWSAAYDKAVTELGPTMDAGELDAEAVRRADSAVRITQGSKTPLDVPVILSGNALAQLFTQFVDYPNTVLNQNIAAPVGQRLAVLMWTLMVPTLASTAIGLTFAFGEIKSKGERADDEYWKRLLRHTFGDQVRGAFSLIPVVGGLAGSAMNALYGLDNNAGGLRNQPFAGWSLIDMAQRVFAGEGSPADLLSVGMSAIGIPARPVVNVLRYEDRVAKGKEEREWLDYVRVLLNGN